MEKVTEKDFCEVLNILLATEEEKKQFVKLVRGKKCQSKK